MQIRSKSIALSWFITTLLPSQILEDLPARCPRKVLGSVRLGVVGGDVMVEHHKQEDRHAKEVGEHRQLNVAYHYSEDRVDRDIITLSRYPSLIKFIRSFT